MLFWPTNNKFLLVEILPEKTSGILLEFDENRTFKILREWEKFEWAKYSSHIKPNRFIPTVILAVHPTLVHTSLVPVDFERLTPGNPLTSVELENMLGKMLISISNEERARAAQALHVEELNAVLVQSRITSPVVDGRETINPVGQPGKKLEAVFEITFTTRDIFEQWRNFFNSHDGFRFVDMSRAHLSAISKVKPSPVSLIMFEKKRTRFYGADESKKKVSTKKGQVHWTLHSLLEPIMETWGVGEYAAQGIYEAYLRKEVSGEVEKIISKLLKPVIRNLAPALAKTKLKGKVHVYSQFSLPFPLPKKIGNVVLEELPLSSLLEKLGFEQRTAGFPPHRIFHYLVSFLEFYYDKENSPANRWLKRRVHWLTPV